MTSRSGWARMCVLSLLGSLLTVFLIGCAQVHLIRDTPDEGVVSIPTNSNQWPTYYRNRAESLMSKKCPQGYTIVGEKVVEGNPAARDGRKPNENFDYDGGFIRITTYNREEYHIAFRRIAAVPDAPLASPSSDATDANKGELPPPRPMPSEPRP